jgi:hypothetical protein
MTDVKKTEKAPEPKVETKAPAPVEKKADETPEVAHVHEVGEDTYFYGVDGSQWVERGE